MTKSFQQLQLYFTQIAPALHHRSPGHCCAGKWQLLPNGCMLNISLSVLLF